MFEKLFPSTRTAVEGALIPRIGPPKKVMIDGKMANFVKFCV